MMKIWNGQRQWKNTSVLLYNEEIENNCGKTKYDYYKRKRLVAPRPKLGFYTKAVQEFDADIKDAPNNDPDFQRPIKVATRGFDGIAEPRIVSSKESTCFWRWTKI